MTTLPENHDLGANVDEEVIASEVLPIPTPVPEEVLPVVEEAEAASEEVHDKKNRRGRKRKAADEVSPADPAVPLAPAVLKPERIRIVNRQFQLLVLEVRGSDGKFHTLQIQARGEVLWPKVDDLGADAKIKLKRGFVQIFPA